VRVLPPPCTQSRVKGQRKKAFDEAQRKALAAASAALAAATAAAGSKDAKADGRSSSSSEGAAPPAAAAADEASKPDSSSSSSKAVPPKSELEARVAYLGEAYKAYDDPGGLACHEGLGRATQCTSCIARLAGLISRHSCFC
jgi:hypothetical protein